MPQVRLFSRWGSLFAGETGEYPDAVAEMLVREKRGKLVLADGSLQPWPGEEVNTDLPTDKPSNIKTTEDSGFVFDATKDPFMLDGLDEATATALHVGGLHTPGDVEAYLAGGKALTDIPKITPAKAKKVVELYGAK